MAGSYRPHHSNYRNNAMSNVVEFKLPPGRRFRKDKRIKVGLNHPQLVALDAEVARRHSSRSGVIADLLTDLIERQQNAWR